MEYVGGQSLNNLLKSRMKAANGTFSAIPLDQAIAYMIEVLPAFSYLHGLGLLYCDFKPANLIQVGDGIKLIDLGGVRRVDDDVSIYGKSVQAPRGASEGTASRATLTVARTLPPGRVQVVPEKLRDSLPTPEEVPLFREDSRYGAVRARQRTEDGSSREEMSQQLIGVISRATIAPRAGAVTRSTT